MDPKVANALWMLIHSNADLVDKGKMTPEEFANSFVHLVNDKQLPCATCRADTANHISKNPIRNTPESPYRYLRWTFDFHNSVNIKLNKEQFPWDRCLAMYASNNEIVPCSFGCNSNKGVNDNAVVDPQDLVAPSRKSHIEGFFPFLDGTPRAPSSSKRKPKLLISSS